MILFFQFVSHDQYLCQEILTAGAVCSGWFRVSRDELLWKSLVKRDWNVDPKIGLAPGNYLKSYCEILY